MALAIATVITSIASLSVSGVTIKDDAAIPINAERLGAVLYPEPVDFISDIGLERDSYGGGSVAKMTFSYTLNYTFCYTPVGSGRYGLDQYSDLVNKIAAILDAIIAIDTIGGAVDIVPKRLSGVGPVPDPSGNMYLGCKIAVNIMEFVN